MVYIRIQNQSNQAKALVDLLKTMPFVEILEEKEPNATTKKAMDDADQDIVEEFNSAEELIKALND